MIMGIEDVWAENKSWPLYIKLEGGPSLTLSHIHAALITTAAKMEPTTEAGATDDDGNTLWSVTSDGRGDAIIYNVVGYPGKKWAIIPKDLVNAAWMNISDIREGSC